MECPTGKVRYANKIRALLAVVKIEGVGPREPGGRIPRRVYKCFCGAYHLTSQKKNDDQDG